MSTASILRLDLIILIFFLVERPKSYYDWQQSLKSKGVTGKKSNNDKTNSLGIDDSEFKQYLKKWKRKNLH